MKKRLYMASLIFFVSFLNVGLNLSQDILKTESAVGINSVLGYTYTTESGFVIAPPHPVENVTLMPSSKFSVKANGGVVKVRKASETSDAWFFFGGKAEVKVKYHEPIHTYEVSPRNLPAEITTEENIITIKLHSPRKFIIYNVNGDNESLSVFAEYPPENVPDVTQSNVKDVTSFIAADKLVSIAAATNHDQLIVQDVSTEISEAVNSLSDGDVLFFPAGVYPASAVKLKSNMELYFFPGSVLYSTRGSRELNGSDTPLLDAEHCDNVSIRGPGTIMSNGQIYNGGGDGKSRQIPFKSSGSNLVYTDFMIREQQHWSWLLGGYSQNVLIRNVKILTSLDGNNRDGFGISSAENILIEDNFVHSGDDALVIKASAYWGLDNYKLIARNNVIWNMNSGGGIKIGTKFWHPGVYNLAFENNYIISAPRSLSFYFSDNDQDVRDVVFKNTICEKTHARPGANEYLMDFKSGSATDMRFVNLHVIHNSPFLITTPEPLDIFFNGFYRYSNGINADPVVVLSVEPGMPDSGVRFANDSYTLLGIKSLVNVVKEPGSYEVFSVYRSGDVSDSLTIPYSFRSNAISGLDFTELKGEEFLEAGQTEAIISVEFKDTAFSLGHKNLVIVPEHIDDDNIMMGVDYHAGVAIIGKHPSTVKINEEPLFQCILYPNPCEGRFTVNMNRVVSNISYSVLDSAGRIVVSDQKFKSSTFQIDLTGYKQGLYFVIITSDNGSNIMKLVKT